MPKKKGAEPKVTPLTKEQQFYIKGNMEVVTVERIAADLRLSVDRVEEYIATLSKERKKSRMSSLMQRPAKGVVAMTEAASMAADDFRKSGLVTQAEINAAAAAGNYKLAAELAEKKENQQSHAITQQQARYSSCWHYIRPPGEE